ncbi:hypothetical protein Q4601_10560 [Shewanella sp. 1_MG-2023]|uniref:hypothetical protein n=1 Tax=unclassified Shewanella TaxID=196818 RepID=UPI0026E333A6|nr:MULTISPECIES: hypothetical protein [unclassified Shewanella]MDO6611011.1 hypothetical protein [Shewanella sp. 7_MG-2023]MDO6770138.1 hypothetical protein [Shewanella sp. 2_MG-2023]MDO6794750.1 hypothetical protein [Shewanella sp. 1_MG-2023]
MLVMSFKERWRAAELASAIEKSLVNDPVWKASSNSRKSIDDISRKLASLVITDFRRIEPLPKTLTEAELLGAFFSGFSMLINNSVNQQTMTKTDYSIIALARGYALNIDLSHNQALLDHASSVIQVANNWDKHIRNVNQRRNTRFTV